MTMRQRETVSWCARVWLGAVFVSQMGCLEADEVVTAVSAGIARIQDHMGACVADGIHAGVYRQVNAREIADLAWSTLLGNLDAAEMTTNLGMSAETVAARARRAGARPSRRRRPTSSRRRSQTRPRYSKKIRA